VTLSLSQSDAQKFHVKQSFTQTGDISDQPYLSASVKTLRVAVQNVGGGNVVEVQGRIKGMTSWVILATITGATAPYTDVDVSLVDELNFEVTTYSASGGTPEVVASGFFNIASAGGESFTTIDTDAGTFPVATGPNDTLTLTSSDSTILITGTAGTDTVNFTAQTGQAGHPFDGEVNAVVFTNAAGNLKNSTNFIYNESTQLFDVGFGSSVFSVSGTSGMYNQLAVAYKRTTITISGSTANTNARSGNRFFISATSNFTLANPTNPQEEQPIIWYIKQDASGGRVLSLGSDFILGSGIPSVTLSTTANVTDAIGAIYNAVAGKWVILAYQQGYAGLS
jgi:hypothetical protein